MTNNHVDRLIEDIVGNHNVWLCASVRRPIVLKHNFWLKGMITNDQEEYPYFSVSVNGSLEQEVRWWMISIPFGKLQHAEKGYLERGSFNHNRKNTSSFDPIHCKPYRDKKKPHNATDRAIDLQVVEDYWMPQRRLSFAHLLKGSVKLACNHHAILTFTCGCQRQLLWPDLVEPLINSCASWAVIFQPWSIATAWVQAVNNHGPWAVATGPSLGDWWSVRWLVALLVCTHMVDFLVAWRIGVSLLAARKPFWLSGAFPDAHDINDGCDDSNC